MPEHSRQHHVRRIVLPSGRTIEVVRFTEADLRVRQLHICPECAVELVQPITWTEAEGGRWDLTLECPNCWWSEEGCFNGDQVQLLEETLDEGLSAMLRDLKQLAHANMVEEIERFVAALRTNVILPEDF